MKKPTSLSKKITVLILIIISFCLGVIGTFSYLLYRSDSVNSSVEKLLSIAQAVASGIDPEEYKAIMESGEKTAYWERSKQFADQVMADNNLEYLYILDRSYDDQVTYFLEGGAEAVDLHETEPASYHSEKVFETLETGNYLTHVYYSEDFGTLASGFAPIKDQNGNVLAVVGTDLDISDVMASSRAFGLNIIIAAVLFEIMFALIATWYINKNVGKPIRQLTKASQQIEQGDTDIDIKINSNDEIGELAASFKHMNDSTKKQVQVLQVLAQGDLTVEITPRCDEDSMSYAMIKMVDNLHNIFKELDAGAHNVSAGSGQIASAAQTLAQGSAQQASAVAQVRSDITDVAKETEDCANMATTASTIAGSIMRNATKGSSQMDMMIESVKDISKASNSINEVIKVIDDIAFQTNILALNAAVEAAHAGQHGKGFAVVAEEVKNLAAKSASAAKDSETLILNSIEKAKHGTEIANSTAVSFRDIVSGIEESNKVIENIAKLSDSQKLGIENIQEAVNQITAVVEQNSATAEESAASSEELNSQSEMLKNLMDRFKLKSDMLEGEDRLRLSSFRN